MAEVSDAGALLGWGVVKPRKPRQKSSEIEIAYKPVAIDGIDNRNIVSVSAGSSHALALDEFGQVEHKTKQFLI